MRKTFIPDQIFNGSEILENVPITIEDGRFLCFDTMQGASELKISGLMTAGFVDVQVNGGGGVLFNNEPTKEAISAIFTAHSKFGTTSYLPTLITDDLSVMRKAADAVSAALKENMDGVCGIHFEGPHISALKKGAHSEKFIREISDDEMEIYARQDIGVRHITLAPENIDVAVIKKLTEMGVTVSLGHSAATYEQANAALHAGATGFTHLYNAMSAFEGRTLGMVGAALLSKDSWCGIIVDGHHVHNDSVRLAVNVKAQGKIMLVTDAMPPVGTGDCEFLLLGKKIIRDGGKLTAPEGQLAGSVLDMASAVRNTIQKIGLSKEEALKMASQYPADFIGMSDHFGRIKIGLKANFTIMSQSIKSISTWAGGVQAS